MGQTQQCLRVRGDNLVPGLEQGQRHHNCHSMSSPPSEFKFCFWDAGLTVSAQDRFLIMAAEMEQPCGTGTAELSNFWKEVPRNKVMEHR